VCMCLCVSVSVWCVCGPVPKCARQKDRLDANMTLFKFKLYFRCVCRMHNEENATCNIQLLLCVL
jgi:hypothetical protein